MVSAPSPGGLGPGLRAGLASSPQLNTPGQQPAVSPCTLNEEAAYREKIRHLSKYIEPLRRMIARVGNEGKNQARYYCHTNYLIIFKWF